MSVTKSHLYSFGGPHSMYNKVYNPDNPQPVNVDKTPGPGHYDDTMTIIGKTGPKYHL
jgi:hypothetical protein